MSTDAKAIRADRFAEIGIIIQRDATILIDRWIQRARQDQPQAQRMHLQTLQDDLPHFLTELGHGLTVAGDPFHAPHCSLAIEHGEQRWQAGWSLEELIRDYQILRLVVLDYLDEVLDRSLQLREVLAVGLALDEAISASVSRYMQFCDQRAERQNEALRSADRRKNEFLATLAHELRNPLAPLRNALDVIRLNGADPESMSQLREIMERQVQQMTRLVDDLLDMSRVELGKLTLRKERVDLRNVLSHAVQTVTPMAQARQQDLVFDSTAADPLWVEGDETRLVQVFINLLHNATKFTPTRGRIEVRTEIDSGVVTVHVVDNGPGVPPHMQGRIFDLFAQAEEGEYQAHGGLGIGLALVRRLVERHEGSVALTSSSDGSDFRVRLPLIQEGPALVHSAPAHTDPGTKRRILLIEDHPDGRDSLAFLLRLVGHEVAVAENGLRGIELAQAQSPEFALVDIGLPDIDGYEVARRLRGIFGNRICLIALTGFSQPEDRARAVEAGFDSHTTKPVELQTLQSLLAAYAPTTSGADSAGRSPSS